MSDCECERITKCECVPSDAPSAGPADIFTQETVMRLRGIVRFCKDMSGGQANTRWLEGFVDRIAQVAKDSNA